METANKMEKKMELFNALKKDRKFILMSLIANGVLFISTLILTH